MTDFMAIALESLVALLLAVVIVYCIILDKRLQRLRLNEGEMRKTITDLASATQRAERAVELLRAAIDECDVALADRLRSAERQSQELAERMRAGSDVLARISRIVTAGKNGAAA